MKTKQYFKKGFKIKITRTKTNAGFQSVGWYSDLTVPMQVMQLHGHRQRLLRPTSRFGRWEATARAVDLQSVERAAPFAIQNRRNHSTANN